MGKLTSIGNVIGSDRLAKVATGTAGAVYVMTGIKAIGRPIFIYRDKTADEKKKRYAATAEFLYQLLCLGITLSVVPFFKKGGFKLASKYLKGSEQTFLDKGYEVLKQAAEEKAKKSGKAVKVIKKPEKLNMKFFVAAAKSLLKPYKEVCKEFDSYSEIAKKGGAFDIEKYNAAKAKKESLQDIAEKAYKGLGGIEAGSFIGSILGLTMIAPPLSHKIVHPTLKAFGLTKGEEQKPTLEQLQTPALSEAHHKNIDEKV